MTQFGTKRYQKYKECEDYITKTGATTSDAVEKYGIKLYAFYKMRSYYRAHPVETSNQTTSDEIPSEVVPTVKRTYNKKPKDIILGWQDMNKQTTVVSKLCEVITMLSGGAQ